MIKTIIKRNGKEEAFEPVKLRAWTSYGAEGSVKDIDWPTIMLTAANRAPERISSQDLQRLLIEVTLEGKTWSHYKMAGRLYANWISKKIHGDTVPTIRQIHDQLIGLGRMVEMGYTASEYAELEAVIDHVKDREYPHFSIEYLVKKYAISDHVKKLRYETPQFIYMRMAMAIAAGLPNRVERAKSIYISFKDGLLSAPTPNYINFGTPLKGFASCCIYDSGDTAKSINAGNNIAYTMTYMSAGIGKVLNTRSVGDSVRSGSIKHQGKLPYIKATKELVSSNLQNSRGGAATITWNIFDPEAFTLLALQNPMTPEAKRIRGIDYSAAYTPLLLRYAIQKKNMFHFNVRSAPDLYHAMYSSDKNLFGEIYAKYEADNSFHKDYFSAREVLINLLMEAEGTGRYYYTNVAEVNHHTPHLDPIRGSNLCVAPETLILTDKGEVEIASKADQEVNIWNGEEWSAVTVRKTGENQKLLTVTTDSGQALDCTPEHKFYIVENYHSKPKEVRAGNLRVGDALIKFDFPVIEGEQELDKAYINGFYSGDGCESPNGQRIYLYGDKMSLAEEFNGGSEWTRQVNYNRIYKHYKCLKGKDFVPVDNYDLKSRLEWLAGYADADGCIYRNGSNQQLVLISVDFKLLRDTQRMLSTMGVGAKIKDHAPGGMVSLPLNDGSGEKGEFLCKQSWRLIVTSNDLQKLLALGINFRRLSVFVIESQRCAKHFVRITSVADTGRISDTYCFTEPKRHMGVFNGILTGQCQEIHLPIESYQEEKDLWSSESIGKVELELYIKGQGNRTLELPYVTPVRKDSDSFDSPVYLLKKGDQVRLESTNVGLIEGLVVEDVKVIKKEAEVAMCNLAAIAPSRVLTDASRGYFTPEEIKEYTRICYDALLMIDVAIHSADYPLAHIGYTAKNRLNAGVGLMGVATYLARSGLEYTSQAGKDALHRLVELHSFCCITASLQLSRELGVAPWMHRTKWVNGWLPVDTYNRNVDSITEQPLLMDWESLRSEIIANGGIRNSTVVSMMPGESSSKALGLPNSIYPVRDTLLIKTDFGIVSRFAAESQDNPDYKYQSAWDIPMKDQSDMYAIVQKFTDQGISADSWRKLGEGELLPSSKLLEDFFYFTKVGNKARYYTNTMISTMKQLENGDMEVIETIVQDTDAGSADCAGGACKA